MTMSNRGLNKLVEEMGEAIQAAGKKLAYPEGKHPDGGPPLNQRLEDELADVQAAIHFVTESLQLNKTYMARRTMRKLMKFREWDQDPNN